MKKPAVKCHVCLAAPLFKNSGQTHPLWLKQRSPPCWMLFLLLELCFSQFSAETWEQRCQWWASTSTAQDGVPHSIFCSPVGWQWWFIVEPAMDTRMVLRGKICKQLGDRDRQQALQCCVTDLIIPGNCAQTKVRTIVWLSTPLEVEVWDSCCLQASCRRVAWWYTSISRMENWCVGRCRKAVPAVAWL